MVEVACLLVGHDDVVLREPARLALRCRRCGRTTAGWMLDPVPADARVAEMPGPGSTRPAAADPSSRARVTSARLLGGEVSGR